MTRIRKSDGLNTFDYLGNVEALFDSHILWAATKADVLSRDKHG